MVNVDYVSPSLWLGIILAGCGLLLTSYRATGARGLSDTETVTSSLLVLSGGILAVVGWRLDPILMLSEGILGSVGVYYIVQTVKLRAQVQDQLGSYSEPRREQSPAKYENSRPSPQLPPSQQWPNGPPYWREATDSRRSSDDELPSSWQEQDAGSSRLWADADFDRRPSSDEARTQPRSWQQRRAGGSWRIEDSLEPRAAQYRQGQSSSQVPWQEAGDFGVESSVPEQVVPADMWRSGAGTAPVTRQQRPASGSKDGDEPRRPEWGTRQRGSQDDW